MKYMIELHSVLHEIEMYLADIRDFGEIVYYSERFPTVLWLESEWDKDILEAIYGVKQVREPKYKYKGSDNMT